MSTAACCIMTGTVKVTFCLWTKINLYPTSHVHCPTWLKFSSRDLNIGRGAFISLIKFGEEKVTHFLRVSITYLHAQQLSASPSPHLYLHAQQLSASPSPHLYLHAQHLSASPSPLLYSSLRQGMATFLYYCQKKKMVKRSRYRPGPAQSVGRGIALLFHDRGTRRG